MKQYKLIIIAICLFNIGCNGILDKDPIATLDAGSFFQNEEDAVQAVNAAYNPLLFSNQNNNYYWAFSEITSDFAITGGDGSRAGLTELDAFTYTARTQEFNDFYKLQYIGITQCNLVLDNIVAIDMRQDVKDRVRGEALFLRSYYYFLLTQVFGEVPLYTKVTPPDELKVAKTAKQVIYDQIVKDCQEAAELLPVAYSASNIGRATKGAALALAAKTFLYKKDYASCLNVIESIKQFGIYKLTTDYNDNFKKLTQNNTESVWEIQHTNSEIGVGNFLNQWLFSKKVNGYGFAEVTESFVNMFEANDPRSRFTIAKNNEEYFGAVYKNSFSSTKYSTRKYLQPDSEVTQKADGDINYTAIRYAEVLLWQAEALNELGRAVEAQQPLEEVRARARAQASVSTALPAVTATDQNEMRNAIIHERAVELGFEFHRFFDLVRWGIAEQTLPGFVKGKHEVFPLPQTELDLNPALLQNNGY